MARARRRTLRPPGSVPSVARPRSMQASITDQSRSRPASRVAWPPAVSLARFIAAIERPEASPMASISAAVAKG